MPKPPQDMTAAREAEAWKLRARGISQARIAAFLNLTQSGVSRLLARVERRELRRLAESVERIKVAQHHQLEHVVSEAMEAWDRSKQPRKRAGSRRSMALAGDDQGDDDRRRAETPVDEVLTSEVIERDGDTGYLYCAMQGLRDIRSLWGLDVAPAAQDVATNIARISADIDGRARAYESRQADAGAGDPAGAGGDAPGGGLAVQDPAVPVQ